MQNFDTTHFLMIAGFSTLVVWLIFGFYDYFIAGAKVDNNLVYQSPTLSNKEDLREKVKVDHVELTDILPKPLQEIEISQIDPEVKKKIELKEEEPIADIEVSSFFVANELEINEDDLVSELTEEQSEQVLDCLENLYPDSLFSSSQESLSSENFDVGGLKVIYKRSIDQMRKEGEQVMQFLIQQEQENDDSDGISIDVQTENFE